MGYYKWMIISVMILGFINIGFTKPSNTAPNEDGDYDDFQGDDDYPQYDDDLKYDTDKSAPVEDNDTTSYVAPPYFEIPAYTTNFTEGEDAILFCDVQRLSNTNIVMWYNGTNIVTNGKTSLNSERIDVLEPYAIKIKDIQKYDENVYHCQVLPELVWLNVTVNVLEKRKVAIYLDGRDVTRRSITFREGERVEFECKAHGISHATIKWSLKGERLGNHGGHHVKDGKVIFDHIDVHHAGVYQCLGDDGSEKPPHGSVNLNVQYAPKVSTHRHYVNTEQGDVAELYCDYSAEPQADPSWRRNEEYLTTQSEKYVLRNILHNGRNRSILVVNDVDSNDLGEYKCEAENSIGRNFTKIHLVFEPEVPQFEKLDFSDNGVSLYWLVRSKQALVEATVGYQLNGTKNWSTVSPIKTDKHHEHTGIWKIRHNLELEAGTYHARLKTKNTVNWSKYSHEHTFTVTEGIQEKNNDVILKGGIGGTGKPGSGFKNLPNGLSVITCLLVAIYSISSLRNS